jgi:hypothetical protein
MVPCGASGTSSRRTAYHLYGLRVRSEWPLPYPHSNAACLGEVGLVRGLSKHFSNAAEEARTAGDDDVEPRCVRLSDGEMYLRWSGQCEFLVSVDGRLVSARPLRRSSPEAFHTYLLGQALSFALIKQGFDPLHATVVEINGVAVAFLGDSGSGKSTLAAAFVRAGHRLLTDDLLVLSEQENGFTAHPGPPRIKLFPRIARSVLTPNARGVAIAWKMPKLVIALAEGQTAVAAMPLKIVYVLGTPARSGRQSQGVTIRRLSKRQACLSLIRNTFNTAVTDSDRLIRQFGFATDVAASLPVKQLTYPRVLDFLPAVRQAILADLARIAD